MSHIDKFRRWKTQKEHKFSVDHWISRLALQAIKINLNEHVNNSMHKTATNWFILIKKFINLFVNCQTIGACFFLYSDEKGKTKIWPSLITSGKQLRENRSHKWKTTKTQQICHFLSLFFVHATFDSIENLQCRLFGYSLPCLGYVVSTRRSEQRGRGKEK